MNIFYVYQYYDPIRKEPIYIGKGYGYRARKHLSASKNKNTQAYRTHRKFYNRINWIRKQGQEPNVTLLEENLSKEEYGPLEIQWVKKIGRKDLNKGPLCNLTDGGEGIRGYKHSLQTKEKLRLAFTGKNNPRFNKHESSYSKYWLIIKPNGEKTKIINLSNFCRDNGLSRKCMWNIANGKQNQHKGFSCKLIYRDLKNSSAGVAVWLSPFNSDNSL